MTSIWWSVWQFLIKNTQWFCSLLFPQDKWKRRSLQNSYTNINGSFIYNSSELETTQMSKSWIYNISMYIHTAKNYCTVERNVTTDTYKMNWSQKQKSQVKESIYCVIPVTWWHGSRTGGSDWWWRKSDQRLPRAREAWDVDQTPENRGTPLGWSWRLWRSQMEVIFAKICQILHVKWVSFIAWNYTRLLCPWDSPGRNTGVGFHFLLQGISRPRDQSCIFHVSYRRVLHH